MTFDDINEKLMKLDTEYCESLAHYLVDKKYVSDSPLKLSIGTDEQKKELIRVVTSPLKEKEVKELMKYISKEMHGDFQYGQFIRIRSEILSSIEKEAKNKERVIYI